MLAEELFSVANRGYIPGFLAGNPNANAQFYERNGGFQTKLFVGQIREYDAVQKLARIEVKNEFRLGEEIEVMIPGKVWTQSVDVIYKT